MSTDTAQEHQLEQHRRPYRSNGTWQIVLAIALVPVWFIVAIFSALETGFCGDWGSNEECTTVREGAVVRVSVFAVAIIVLFVIGVIRRRRSNPSSTLDSARLAKISAGLGAVTLALLLATMRGGVGLMSQLGLLCVATAATAVGVAALINLPQDTRSTRTVAFAGIAVAIVSLVVGLSS